MDGHTQPLHSQTHSTRVLSLSSALSGADFSLFLFISLVSSGRCRTSGSGLLLPSLLTYLLAAGACRLAQIRAPQVKRERWALHPSLCHSPAPHCLLEPTSSLLAGMMLAGASPSLIGGASIGCPACTGRPGCRTYACTGGPGYRTPGACHEGSSLGEPRESIAWMAALALRQ